jgi:undecaprenyl-diphosphatase
MDQLQALDRTILDWFQSIHRPWLDRVMIDISALGGVAVSALIVSFTVGLLLTLHRARTALFVLGAAVGGAALMQTIKYLIGRQRPHLEKPLVIEASHSFPSGHSMLAAVIFLTLALIAAAVVPRRRVRVYLVVSSLILVGMIGVSRMYLGVHYCTDVVTGWVAGLAWAMLCRWVESHWVLRAERHLSPSPRAAARG